MLSFLVPVSQLSGQCSLITKNGSSQDPKTVCAPVDFTMNVWFKFLIPVNTSLVEIRFVWNDGMGSVTTVPGVWNAAGDSIWAEASHIYPPNDECSKTADAYVIFDGDVCTSSGHQEQTFSTWGTDEENSGVLSTDPVVAYFCEGEDIVNVTFDDNSTFNCNIGIEPDNPNRYYRWIQFVYNTYTQGGDRIPDITIDDGAGTVYTMTDNAGNFVSQLDGPIIQIPIPADGPNQTSYAISAPAGGVAGDIFEITLRNWNVCNPYDNLPSDGLPPADILNGDNAPILTTARIEIIAPPPVVVSNLFEFCTGDDIELTATAGGAEVRWYSDSSLTNLLHIGNNFDPEAPPLNLDHDVAGTYTFWVTSLEGMCESIPNRVDVEVYQSPVSVFAGNDQLICNDSIYLSATPPSAGTGIWSTSGTSNIVDPGSPATWVRNLEHGNNSFTWTVANGICQTTDQVNLISDRQPDPAFAGPGDSTCSPGSINLAANPPNLGGTGHWLIIEGFGTLPDTASPSAQLVNPSSGWNTLIWRVSSEYGACPVTLDTVAYFVDLVPGAANAGPDDRFCEVSTYNLSANPPLNSGAGTWEVVSGSSVFSDLHDPLAQVSNLQAGDNSYVWHLNSRFGLCPSTYDSIRLTRDLSPGIANAGPSIALCLENSDTLSANAPAFGAGEWDVLINPSGTAPIFSPDRYTPDPILTVLPGNEGLYVLSWTLENGTCTSTDTMVLDFGVPPPPGFAGVDSTVCGLRTWLQSNTFAQGHGMWNQLTGPGLTVFTPDVYDDNPEIYIPGGSEGTYTYQWMLTSGACAPSSDTVQVTFLGAPPDPLITGGESCGPASFTLEATVSEPNVLVEWFTSMSAGAPFHSDQTYTTPLLSATTTYYVESVDTLTGCRSPRFPVPAIIHAIPDLPVLNGDTLCGAGIAGLSGSIAPPATSIRWFTGPGGSILIAEGLSVNHPVSSSQYILARAIDTLYGCVSGPDSVRIIVYPDVPEPVAVSDSSCGPADLLLTAIKSGSSNDLYWYTMPGASTPFRIQDSVLLIGASSPVSFWIAEVDNSTGCASDRVQVDGLIHAVPGPPVLNDTTSCGPAAFILRPQGDPNSNSFRWYDQPIGGTLLQESPELNTGLLSSSISYWVSGYHTETSCEGPRSQVDISIFPIPAPITIIGPTLVLKDQSGVIFSTTGNSTSTYVWTVPAEISVDENMNDFLRLSFPNTGSYTLSVYEITANGCVGDPVSHPVTVINDSIAVDIGLYHQAACTAVPFNIKPYLFGGTPPYTYSWTGDIAYLSSTSSLFTTFNPPGTGSYHLYLQVVDVNLKTSTDSVEITMYTSPTANITTDNQVVCVGDELHLQVATTGYPAVSHLWQGPIQNLSSYAIQDPVYTPHQPDTVQYFYTLTDVNGCKATDSTRIYSDIPLAYFELLTDPGCSPLEMSFRNLSERAVGYAWDFGDGSGSSAENPSHNYVNQSAEIRYYPVTLEAVSILGCRDEITQYAMVWPNPVAKLEALPETACSPAEITLFSTPGNKQYIWDFGDGETSTGNSFNISHLFTAETEHDEVYPVKVITVSSLNCVDSAFLNLNIHASPVSDFRISPPSDTFPNNVFEITNLTEGLRWETNWTLGDGRTLDIRDPGVVRYDNPGNYTVSLTSSSEYCADSVSKTVYLHPAKPQAKFAGPEPGCMPHTVTFINTSSYADEYLWEFGDGSISTSPNPSYTYYEAGLYRVSLTVKGPGGESSYSDTARVHVLPNAFFDMAPRYVYVNDEAVNFFNLSEKADTFEWDFGDGDFSSELNPKHVYKEEGTFDITLKVWTNHQCFDLYVMENAVFVEPSGIIEFPNAFRPDSPLEENREFLPGIIDHVDEYHLMIFNRWGELIFESYNQEIGWDGYYKGEPAKQDVYIWKVTGSYSDGKGFSKTGDVTLLY
ncbi:MAG: PKD domain-containing protein [Bacteroidales bacterium]|nr:PKD domain-containing protein [Bacteroidales bacterium]